MIEVKCKCGKSLMTFANLRRGDIADGQPELDCCAIKESVEEPKELDVLPEEPSQEEEEELPQREPSSHNEEPSEKNKKNKKRYK